MDGNEAWVQGESKGCNWVGCANTSERNDMNSQESNKRTEEQGLVQAKLCTPRGQRELWEQLGMDSLGIHFTHLHPQGASRYCETS